MSEKKYTFDAIDALNGLFSFGKRSGTLDGSAPLRAAQYCQPFNEGCAAGMHIYATMALLKKTKSKGIDIYFTDEVALSDETYENKLNSLIEKSLLSKYWGKRLHQGPTWQDAQSLYVWTGFLVKPSKGSYLLLGSAFNRRASFLIEDLIYADSDSFQPLILKISKNQFTDPYFEMNIDTEIACLLPVSPQLDFRIKSLNDGVTETSRLADFFDDKYFTDKSKHSTNKYKKLLLDKKNVADVSQITEVTELIKMNISIKSLQSTVTSSGIGKLIQSPPLRFFQIRNQFSFQVNWDGNNWGPDATTPKSYPRLKKQLDTILKTNDHPVSRLYDSCVATSLQEPFFNILPWILIKTPDNWSCVFDGIHHKPTAEGLRGVVATDRFHHVIAAYKAIGPAKITFKKNIPVLRLIPIPREFLFPDVNLITM